MSRKHIVSGGGTRSEEAPAYNLVPGQGHKRIAKRFSLGAKIHGVDGWKKSCQTEKDAAAWAKETFNHMQEHMLKMSTGRFPDDDHLGAIGWGVEVLAYLEDKFNKPWTELSV